MKTLNTRFNTNNTIYNLRSVFYTLEMKNNLVTNPLAQRNITLHHIILSALRTVTLYHIVMSR